MTLFQQGGWVMWPLLALSVLALAIICERAFFFASLEFPAPGLDKLVARALVDRDAPALLGSLPQESAVFGSFSSELHNAARPGACPQTETQGKALALLAEEIMSRMEKNLPFLSMIVRGAPLLGLLGTVLGMINTFSRLTAAQGGVDLTMLADGIWQALLTTAAGLLIAIPALVAHHFFMTRCRRTAQALYLLSNALVVARANSTGGASPESANA